VNVPIAIERVVLALWVGGIWAIGFLVAPELFRSLESRHVAGEIAGNLFSVVNYFGLAAGFILLVLAYKQHSWRCYRQWRTALILAMLAGVMVSQFALTPKMREIKQERLTAKLMNPARHKLFATLHGVSSALYLVTSVSGLVLVVAGATRRAG